MLSTDIDNVIVFRNSSGLKIEVNHNNVGLKVKDKTTFVFNFNLSLKDKDLLISFFEKLKSYENVFVDIGHTGDINCYFMGISPCKKNFQDGTEFYSFSVILKELKDFVPEISEDEDDELDHSCSSCGLH